MKYGTEENSTFNNGNMKFSGGWNACVDELPKSSFRRPVICLEGWLEIIGFSILAAIIKEIIEFIF